MYSGLPDFVVPVELSFWITGGRIQDSLSGFPKPRIPDSTANIAGFRIMSSKNLYGILNIKKRYTLFIIDQ